MSGMYQAVVQQVLNVMIIIMASFLILFTLLLIVLHFITNAVNKRMQQIRQQILRLIKVACAVVHLTSAEPLKAPPVTPLPYSLYLLTARWIAAAFISLVRLLYFDLVIMLSAANMQLYSCFAL